MRGLNIVLNIATTSKTAIPVVAHNPSALSSKLKAFEKNTRHKNKKTELNGDVFRSQHGTKAAIIIKINFGSEDNLKISSISPAKKNGKRDIIKANP